ncbi:asparagine synthase (glutamine-hydrolyzing) [Actinoalloteichus hoggarensis]|uniref:asparagine synthase (glutamine-hydrolyzing) n=1 Tax=Actinoalloteichus hoggarensis TaxID=1470176 RepID=A0A221VZX3_9PSEU|nr:asparagine synthase-related protein [Actinoalloteichus hoggarensis]ASO19089.1 Asparagine synthase [Actinoalloteichus hoggarensis]MBB5920326.1 asparagine synthase (glutamine-hydrolyzing) [Actinoalloteichus hoggarensis]
MDFLIFPDCPAGAAVAETVAVGPDVRVIPHPGGRPWIVGTWSDHEVCHASVGTRGVAFLGVCSMTTRDLTARLDRADGVDLDRLRRAAAGSFHLIASIDGRVLAQGTLSSVRQIFHTRIGGVVVAADRPQSLASATGADIVDELLALQLVSPFAPWPLSDHCLWRGVEALGVGCRLDVDGQGVGRVVRWWNPPPPDVALPESAERVGAALHDAVAARTGPRRSLSADLSGGMDSTSVSFLAAGQFVRLVTTRWEAANPDDEDQTWAAQAAAFLPRAEHVVLTRAETPMNFAGLTTPDADVEAPFAWIRTRSRLAHQARRLAALGSTMHLTGHGGDELFFPSPPHLHALVRSEPLTSIGYLRGYRSMYRWTVWSMMTGLARDPSFGRWLSSSADRLTATVRELRRAPDFGWAGPFLAPRWISPTGVEAVRTLLRRAAAEDPEPMCPLRPQHATMQDVRKCGESVRRVDRLTSRSGVSWQAPFLDDHVVEASLAVRLADSATPYRYKPVLAAAMRDVVPAELLGRGTKSEYSADVYAGLRACRRDLVELCDDMVLARRGLLDVDKFRATLLGMHTSSAGLSLVVATLACETWLRSLSAARTTTLTGGAR